MNRINLIPSKCPFCEEPIKEMREGGARKIAGIKEAIYNCGARVVSYKVPGGHRLDFYDAPKIKPVESKIQTSLQRDLFPTTEKEA